MRCFWLAALLSCRQKEGEQRESAKTREENVKLQSIPARDKKPLETTGTAGDGMARIDLDGSFQLCSVGVPVHCFYGLPYQYAAV